MASTTACLLLLLFWRGTDGFPIDTKRRQSQTAPLRRGGDALFSMRRNVSRRDAFHLSFGGVVVAWTRSPQSVRAKDNLFETNPLTNRFLERFRIWEQAEADDLKYGGELAPGTPPKDGGSITYAKLLLPILAMEEDITRMYEEFRLDSPMTMERLTAVRDIASKPDFQRPAFKKSFNAFADNIYYSDPDRANTYLGGGATPQNEQSLAYLLRNEILTNLENLQSELTFLLHTDTDWGTMEGEDLEDAVQFSRAINEGMQTYLDLVPPMELKMARDMLKRKNE